MKTKRWLSVLIMVLMLVILLPISAAAQEPAPEYAFVPNSGEASVSKVDLGTMKEVARYYTEPRQSENSIPVNYWRTSRIAQDVKGNAFVLNTGADGSNLQGSVARIQADTTGLSNTHAFTADETPLPLTFGTDEAVQVMNIGQTGEIPRSIAIDDKGFIWIGFYSGGYLQKYEYNPDGPSLDKVGDPYRYSTNIKFYDMKFAPDGKLWISSRGSTPSVVGTEGIFSFDPNSGDFTREQTYNPYALLIAEDGTIFVTSYNNQLHIRDTAGVWTVKALTGSSEDRGMAFDKLGNIWIAGTSGTSGGTTVKSYNITSGVQGSTYTLTSGGTTPVGVGMDSNGNMWVVCRTDGKAQGYLEGFNPGTLDNIGAIQVGYRPYAYGNFVIPETPELYEICGYKLNNATGAPIADWIIHLDKWVDGQWEEDIVDPITTGEDGKYRFTDLPAGDYRVREEIEDGWMQVYPGGYGSHEVTLPFMEQNLIENGDFEQGNEEFTSEYTYVASAGTEALWPEGTYAVGTNPQNYHYLWQSFNDHTKGDGSGNMMIVNGEEFAKGRIVWSSSVNVTTDTNYIFSFWGATSYPEAYSTIDVYINGEQIDTYQAPEFLAEWTKYSVPWDSGSSDTAEIMLVCDTLIHTGNDFAIDDISLTANNLDFRNINTYKISGYKLDADAEEGENGLENWTIQLYMKNESGQYPEEPTDTVLTDANGFYCFDNLLAGTYKIKEVLKEGWEQISPENNEHEVTLPDDYDEEAVYNFVNAKLYEICGYKYGVDLNDLESTDNPLQGWSITLKNVDTNDETTAVTDEHGKYCFTGLRAGNYVISESFGEKTNGFWKFDSKYWRPYNTEGSISVTLPEDDGEDISYDFFNQCFTNETAWAHGDIQHNEIPGLTSNNWGWSIEVTTSAAIGADFSAPIYAGAGQNDIEKGYFVGNVYIVYDPEKSEEKLTAQFDFEDVIYVDVQHIWIGNEPLPRDKNNNYTNAPGQLGKNISPSYEAGKPIYMAIHLEVYIPCGYPNEELIE